MSATETTIPKIMHWAVPRSLSTVFMRSMMTNNNVKVFFEPYATPYYFGKDRLSSRYDDEINGDTNGSTIKWTTQTYDGVKETLEENYNDNEAVFVKEMAYAVWQHANYSKLLPNGYIHTFQIRDPRKAVPSMYNASVDIALTGWDYFDTKEAGFKEIRQLYDYVTKVLGQEAIVIDSEDLARHPESIIKQYCRKTGLRYVDMMLDWSDCPIEDMSVFETWEPWLQDMLKSTHFIPPSNKKPESLDGFPETVRQCINESLSDYEHLYANRILP